MLTPFLMTDIDVVSVYHNARNAAQFETLRAQLRGFEGDRVNVIGVDNRQENRGFARGCNYGAKQGNADILGFLNPDLQVQGPFVDRVLAAFHDPGVVITGCRFGKPDFELRIWGCFEWVCGAAMFVRRDWFDNGGGFDEAYLWGWEETDLIRRAQSQQQRVQAIPLPFHHESPSEDTSEDVAYKRVNFKAGAALFHQRWRDR
jgi:GT2 family glycosyltransferase